MKSVYGSNKHDYVGRIHNPSWVFFGRYVTKVDLLKAYLFGRCLLSQLYRRQWTVSIQRKA
jgi:hypothetical protein